MSIRERPDDLLTFGHAPDAHDPVAQRAPRPRSSSARRRRPSRARAARAAAPAGPRGTARPRRRARRSRARSDSRRTAPGSGGCGTADTGAARRPSIGSRQVRSGKTDAHEIDQFAQSVRVRVRTEVARAVVLDDAGEQDARERLVRDFQVGIALVVAQADVERRLVPLDQVRFEDQRLDFVVDDDRQRTSTTRSTMLRGAQRQCAAGPGSTTARGCAARQPCRCRACGRPSPSIM